VDSGEAAEPLVVEDTPVVVGPAEAPLLEGDGVSQADSACDEEGPEMDVPTVPLSDIPVVQEMAEQQERIDIQEQRVDDMQEDMDDIIRLLREAHPELQAVPSDLHVITAPSTMDADDQKIYMQAVQEAQTQDQMQEDG